MSYRRIGDNYPVSLWGKVAGELPSTEERWSFSGECNGNDADTDRWLSGDTTLDKEVAEILREIQVERSAGTLPPYWAPVGRIPKRQGRKKIAQDSGATYARRQEALVEARAKNDAAIAAILGSRL